MAKISKLDAAIAALDGEIAVLEAAKARLVAQRPAPKLPVVALPTEGL